MSYLKALIIEHLRGATAPFSLTFDKGKKLTIVYGENGTGKSTICDAIEFIGKGKVGSLEGKGLGSTTSSYWAAFGKHNGDISVKLESVAGSCSATLHKSNVIVKPADQRPKVEVLRRSQILGLIEATPAERYKAIEHFIDVSGVESSEGALRNLIRETEKNRGEAVARVDENEKIVRQFWETAGKPSGFTSISHWGRHEAGQDVSRLDEEIRITRQLRDTLTNLQQLREAITQNRATTIGLKQGVQVASDMLASIMTTVAGDAGSLLGILQSAKNYFHQHGEQSVCPLCKSPENAKGLSSRVDEQIALMANLKEAQTKKENADASLRQAQSKLENVEHELIKGWETFASLQVNAQIPQDILIPAQVPPLIELEGIIHFLGQNTSLAQTWDDAAAKRQSKKDSLANLQKALETYDTNRKAQEDIDVLLPRLKRALEIMEEERRKFTDETLTKIAFKVGELYEKIHPGEGLDKISLELDPKKRASLGMGASFLGQQGTPPQAYFSDSHLDTLGLCIFLALALMDTPNETILVLDDVIASVDEPHVERLINMLYEVSAEFQHCIMTTHYRPWKEKFKWGWLAHGQCQLVELTKWSQHSGLAQIRSLSELDRLRQHLTEPHPDAQIVAAKAGILLEAALDFLTQLYECSVPRRKDNRYTLGDLLPAIDKKLLATLKIERKDALASAYTSHQLEPIIKDLKDMAQVRNVLGCHFNDLAAHLPEADAVIFSQKVLELMDLVVDSESGWPRNDKSGSYWATAGETRRLHPLRSPR